MQTDSSFIIPRFHSSVVLRSSTQRLYEGAYRWLLRTYTGDWFWHACDMMANTRCKTMDSFQKATEVFERMCGNRSPFSHQACRIQISPVTSLSRTRLRALRCILNHHIDPNTRLSVFFTGKSWLWLQGPMIRLSPPSWWIPTETTWLVFMICMPVLQKGRRAKIKNMVVMVCPSIILFPGCRTKYTKLWRLSRLWYCNGWKSIFGRWNQLICEYFDPKIKIWFFPNQ